MEIYIREVRENKGMGVRELSRLSGVSIGNLSNIENGVTQNPTINTICKLAKALNVHPSELYEC